MASVLEQQKNPIAKFGSQVDEQLAQTTSRIRIHDLSFGVLTLAAFTAFYATTMILLDRYLHLQDWVRELAFLAYVAILAATTYRLIIRPIRSRINPLYAAARVEKTIEDAKNSVMGYVEAQENGEVHSAVKAAMSAKAAKAVGDADLNEAIDHRSLIVAGSVLIFFLLALIVLFFVFRPNQFKSLIGRSFTPFASNEIASQTQLTLIKPDPADTTITTGQTITVAVHVGSKVPSKDKPNRVRVLIRHNQSDPDFEEIPMSEGETTRDWEVKIPVDMVLNGFWYKVAAGDAETQEFRVTVRSLPLFTAFEATYKYPEYTGKSEDKALSANIRAPKGTKVTLIARTNREVVEGTMRLEKGKPDSIPGKPPTPNQTDSLEFVFTVPEQTTNYKLFMTTKSGEKNSDPPTFAIIADSDFPPTIQIRKPEQPEVEVPANGQLAVDAIIGDDYGIEKVRLRLKVGGRDLAPIPYMGGQSFKREKDKTWPKSLEYKDSADFTKLKYADGTPFEAKEGSAIEYWVEAIDNCNLAEPVKDWDMQRGNVGSSKPIQKVRLTAPKTMEEKQDLDQSKGQRKNEEKQHNQAQQQKFNTEKRDQQQPQNGEPKKGENQNSNDANNAVDQKGGKPEKQEPKTGDMNGTGTGDPMNKNSDSNKTEPKNSQNQNSTDPKNPNDKQNPQPGGSGPEGKSDPNIPPKSQPKGMNEPNKDPNPAQPKGMDNQPMGNTNDKGTNDKGGPDNNPNPMQQPGPMSQPSGDDKKTEEQARQVQKEIEKTKRPESEAKPNPGAKPEERTDPAQQKQQPAEGAKPDSPEKEQPKSDGSANKPMSENKNAPSEGKSEGNNEKPMDQATPKPAPSQPDPKSSTNKTEQPSEPRDEPLGGTPGQDKQPKQDNAQPQKTPKNQDAGSGSTSKPATERKENESGKGGDSANNDPNNKQKNPAANAAKSKPKAEPTPGEDKEQNDSKGGSGDDKSGAENQAAKAKPEKASESGTSKSRKQDPMTEKEQEASTAKPAPSDQNPNDPMNGAASSKPDQPKNPMGAGEKNQVEKGMDKPDRKAGANAGQNDPKNQGAQKDNGGLDPKKLEEMQNAAKDLNNPDPKKREEARDTLDKGLGEMNRKAIEQYQKQEREKLDQLQKDLQSPDQGTREAAEKKVEEMMKENQKKGGGEQPKIDQKQLEELKNAAKDLNNPDPKKQEEARNKLDKAIGEQSRKSIEDFQKKEQEQLDQLQKDLKSSDKATQEAAQKKVEDMMNKAKEEAKKNNDGKGKEPSPEEIADLAKKAKDLNSNDEGKRKEAEKALDDKIGKENREKLQEELKKDMPLDPKQDEERQKKLEDEMKKLAKRGEGIVNPNKPQGPPSASTDKLLPSIEDDPRNRAKSAELQLEEFEKNRYNRNLQEKLGWTPDQYEEFLKAQQKRLEQLQKEADKFEHQAKNPAKPVGPPTIDAGGGKKIESMDKGNSNATGASAVFAPEGFERARQKFAEEAQKLKPKQ